MANTDEHGNKLPQPRIRKRDASRMKRERRIMQGKKINPAFCDKCGFRVRSVNHMDGAHHRFPGRG